MKNKEWFANWFDTPYYHILYKDRSFEEAEVFIDKLLHYLEPKKDAKILDLACGKGRHAYFMAKKGFDVKGVDLSAQSILWAKNHYQMENLSFEVHDMRLPYAQNSFDYVFNLFTSFGYFDRNEDNLKVIQEMKANLLSEGLILIDYLNANYVAKQLVPLETKELEGIIFNIRRELRNNFIVKHIEFEDKGQYFHFEERVQALNLDDFILFFKDAGLSLVECFGDYQLNAFDVEKSDRLILIAKIDA